MELEGNYFKELYDIDVSNKKKSKNGLNYLSWAACWSEVKKKFPDATFKIYEETINITETSEGKEVTKEIRRPWFDDGKTGWVKTVLFNRSKILIHLVKEVILQLLRYIIIL